MDFWIVKKKAILFWRGFFSLKCWRNFWPNFLSGEEILLHMWCKQTQVRTWVVVVVKGAGHQSAIIWAEKDYEFPRVKSSQQNVYKAILISTHQQTKHHGWMVSGQETVFCWVPVPYLTMVVSSVAFFFFFFFFLPTCLPTY